MSIASFTLTTNAAVPVEALIEAHRPIVDPSRPVAIRMRVAKGLLPASIEEITPTLAFLTHAAETDIVNAAKESIRLLPERELTVVARGRAHPAVLDTLAHVLPPGHAALSEIAVNRVVADATLVHMAGAGNAAVCELIARNTVRCMGQPAIVEALFFNPQAPPGQVQDLLEFAVREGLDLDHIPGFLEIKEAVLGEEGAKEVSKGLSDIEFLTALAMAVGKEGLTADEQARLEAGESLEDDADTSTTTLQALIHKMSVAQKIRLALVGDANARKLLIRDPKKMVSLAVLKSPRLTDGEVRMFATNKAIAEEILIQICRNRQWTKDYAIRKALVMNPKSPVAMSMGFLRTLSARDIKEVSKSREVSGLIARTAKRILDQAEQARRRG